MAGVTSRAVTIAAKFVGGDLIKKGAGEGTHGIRELGNEVKHTDEKAKKAGGGWQFFSKRTDEAGKAASRSSGHFRGMAKSLIGMAAGMGGGLLAFSTIKSSIDSVGEKMMEMRQAQSLGIGKNSQETLSILAAYKQRGIGTQKLGQTMGQLARSSFQAEQQEGKHAKAGAKHAEQRQRQIEMYDRAVSKVKPGHQMPLPLAKPAEETELGKRAKAYESLGIVIGKFRKLSGTEQLKEVGERLTKMPVGPERTRLAMELLGRSAIKILPAFEKGEGNAITMQKYAEHAFSGVGISGANSMEKIHFAQMRMGIDMEALKLKIGITLIPIISRIIQHFDKLYTAIQSGKGVWGTIESAIKKVVSVGASVIDFFEKNTWAAKSLVGVLAGVYTFRMIERVLKAYQAFKKLEIISIITKLLKGQEAATVGVGVTEGVVAGETVGLSGALAALGTAFVGVGAAIGSMMLSAAPFIAAFAVGGAIGLGINALYKSVFHALGPTEKLHNLLFGGDPSVAALHRTEKTYAHAQADLAAARAAHPHWRWEAAHHRKYPGMASGGFVRHGGTAVVGEQGKEIVNLPAGASVQPLKRGEAVESGTGDLTIPIIVDRHVLGTAVLKDFRQRGARA